MSYNGRTITNIKSKANFFINHYTTVSKRNMSQSERDTNRSFKKQIKVLSVDDESCTSLLMIELQSAIEKMKNKEAAGPDNILRYFSNHLFLWPSRNYYPYSTLPSYLLATHESGGWPLSFHHSKLENLLVGLFPSHQSHIVCPQVSGTCTS